MSLPVCLGSLDKGLGRRQNRGGVEFRVSFCVRGQSKKLQRLRCVSWKRQNCLHSHPALRLMPGGRTPAVHVYPPPSSLHLRLLVEPSVMLHSESEVPRVGKVLDTAASAKILPIKSFLKHKKPVGSYCIRQIVAPKASFVM